MKPLSFYYCPTCGAIITSFKSRGTLTCCGQPLTALEAHNEENAKHSPVAHVMEGELFVKLGQIPHPMDKTHYIAFIAYVTADCITLRELYPEQDAIATFDYRGSGTLYAFCNLHGLWSLAV